MDTQGLSWEKAEEKFILLKSARNSPKTLKTYTKAFRKFRVYWEENHPGQPLPDPRAVTVEEMALYALWLKSKNYGANYVEKMYSILLHFFKFVGNPQAYQMEQLRPKRERKPREYYTVEEIQALLNLYDEGSFPDLMLKTIIHVVALTGMRYFEAANLKWSENVNLREGLFKLKGKGNKWRYVLMPSPLQDLLTKYRKAWEGYKAFCEGMGWKIPGGDSLFFRIDEKGRPHPGTERVYYNRIRRKAKKVGIHFNFKKFRSTIIKIVHNLNYPTDIAALIAGHSDVKTTIDFYHELEIETARPVAEKIARMLLGEVEEK